MISDDNLENEGLLSWGFPFDGQLKYDHPEKKKEVNPDYFECHGCHAHFDLMEMGVMGSPDSRCHAFVEMIQYCEPCMEKEITHLAHHVGIPSDRMYDSKWISEHALLFAKTTDRNTDVYNIEKLLFLLLAKKRK